MDTRKQASSSRRPDAAQGPAGRRSPGLGLWLLLLLGWLLPGPAAAGASPALTAEPCACCVALPQDGPSCCCHPSTEPEPAGPSEAGCGCRAKPQPQPAPAQDHPWSLAPAGPHWPLAQRIRDWIEPRRLAAAAARTKGYARPPSSSLARWARHRPGKTRASVAVWRL